MTIEIADVELDEHDARQNPDVSPGSFVMVAVGDTGVGMDAETVEKIFDPFFTTKGAGQGTGLGLAMVYGLVRQAGGHVAVESEPGCGATFRLYFPRVADRPAVPDETVPSGVRLARGSGTVLLAEDEDAVRRVASRTLRACGYLVLEASDGQDALAVAEQYEGSIDLVLTDVVMPRMNGAELAGRVAARRPGIKVLYMSGYTDKSLVNRGIVDDKVALSVKPFSPESLSNAVREVLNQGCLLSSR